MRAAREVSPQRCGAPGSTLVAGDAAEAVAARARGAAIVEKEEEGWGVWIRGMEKAKGGGARLAGVL